MKTVLITGANKGIGFEIARQLGNRNFHVIISGRNEHRLADALKILTSENIAADMLVMDISNTDSIASAAKTFSQHGVALDVLINNAAIADRDDRTLLTEPFSVIDDTLETNATGALKVIRAFLPHITKPGRIINISSSGGSMTDEVGGWSPAYCISKTLLNAITRQVAFELSSQNISVNAVCPGWVKTDMGGSGASRSIQKGAETPVWLATEAKQLLTSKFFRDKKEIPW